MAAQAEQNFKRKIHGTNHIVNFFTELEAERFPEEIVSEHYPDAVARWKTLGLTQSTPWMWVMLLELCMVSFLAPTAALRPIPSITVYAVLWFFLSILGQPQLPIFCASTPMLWISLSTVRGKIVFGDVTNGSRTVVRLKVGRDKRPAIPLQVGCFLFFSFLLRICIRKIISTCFCSRLCIPFYRHWPRLLSHLPLPGDLSMTLSAGSLEGEGRIMAQPQNLCRAVGFIPEGKRFFRWLQAEGTINEAIATELYERAKWKRNTIHEDRSFAITSPFFAAAGAVHVPDVASLFIEGDPLGIKGRVSFFYTRPAFEHAAAIREANAKINSAGTLLDDVANFFWPCHSTHDPVWAGLDRFVRQKDYPFRFYTLSPDAATVFDERFDHHVDEQKAAHLQDQEKAKFHGKAKTKHLRLALALHLHEQTFARRTSETWETVLDSKHLVVAEEVGKYMDMVATRLGDFFNLVMNPSVPSPSTGAGGARAVKLCAREQLNQILTGERASFQTLPSDQQTAFWTLGQAVLMSHAVWLEGAALARQQNVRAWLPSLGENAIPRVACCLRHLGLIEIVQGKNTHGTALEGNPTVRLAYSSAK